MRKALVLALVAAAAVACGDDEASSGDDVPAWVGEAEIARTPDGATMLWRIELDESGEDGTITWAAFDADGDRIAGDITAYAPWRVRAYDGGFLVVSGSEVPYGAMMLLDEETGEATEPAVLEKPRRVEAGDLAVHNFGTWAFRPSDGSIAPFPGPPRPAFGGPEVAAEGGMLSTAIDAQGVITVLGGEQTNPRKLYRSMDGGRSWIRDLVHLPEGAGVDFNEIFTGKAATTLTLLGGRSVPVGVLVHHRGSWELSSEFKVPLEDYTVRGLAGDRVLLAPNSDGPGYLGDAVVPTKLEAIGARELRPLADGLASMSPTVRLSYDGGQTWVPLELSF